MQVNYNQLQTIGFSTGT